MTDSDCTDRSQLIAALIQSDEMRRSDRADRIVWLSEHQISLDGVVMGEMDSISVLQESRECFIEGHYIATVLLCAAFVEHVITDKLIECDRGRYGISFKEAIETARKAQLFTEHMLSDADHLREIRNPYMHRKPPEHQHSLGNRFLATEMHPRSLLERDAKEALKLTYALLRSILGLGSHSSRSPD